MKSAQSLLLKLSLLFGVAISLCACGTVPNPLSLLDSNSAAEAPAEPAELAMPVTAVSLAMSVDYAQQIKDLDADNSNLKKQLADALNENAKLKRQLSNAMQDNSLLRDLAARKMR